MLRVQRDVCEQVGREAWPVRFIMTGIDLHDRAFRGVEQNVNFNDCSVIRDHTIGEPFTGVGDRSWGF